MKITSVEILIFLMGACLVVFTLNSAIRTFVLPRGDNVWLTRIVFQMLARVFAIRARLSHSVLGRERIWALFAPVALLVLPFFWLNLVTFGFMGLFWAVGVRPLGEAFLLSGSSLLTLGFAPVDGTGQTILAFLEATIGLILIALLIAYLPTMYSVFSRREVSVAKLETYAGNPPSVVAMLSRVHRIKGYPFLREFWVGWETWFAELEESHTTFAPLIFFRSPKPERSWVTAAGTVLDSAAMILSAVDIPWEPQAAICLRSGFLALSHIASFFNFDFNPNPKENYPISITREEFDAVCQALLAQGVPLRNDLDQAWVDFAGWRVNYDKPLLALAALTQAPPAPWSSDRVTSLPHNKMNLIGWVYTPPNNSGDHWD